MRINYARALCALLLAAFTAGHVAAQVNAVKRTTTDGGATDGKATERRVMGSDKFGLSQIGQVAVTVGDLERATAFYRDRLGMKYLFTANGMAFFDSDGIRLMLARPEGSAPVGTSSVIYFKVADIQEGYKALSERGVRFEERPELAAKTEKFDLWLACFKDSENNNLCLMSEVSAKK